MPLIVTPQRNALALRAAQPMRVLAQPKASTQCATPTRVACVLRISERRALTFLPLVHAK